MIASEAFLAFIVTVAVGITAVTPFILIYLWIRDWIKQQLW